MRKKLLSFFTNNLPLKIMSVLIAIVIWYAVVNLSDPVQTNSYTCTVNVENESYIANGKQSFYIENEYKTVTVYVKDNLSVLNNLQNTSITVTADLTQIVDLEREPVMVPLTATIPGVDQENITLSRTTIPIVIEDVASQEFPIVVDMGITTPASDYEVGTTTPSQSSVTINGPESIVSQIDSVIAQIDVAGMTESGEKTATIKLLDKAQNTISTSTIEDNLTFDGAGTLDVTVAVELWKKHTGVGFSVGYSGTPKAGYKVTNITTVPTDVSVVGNTEDTEILAGQNDMITIPADRVSVEGKDSDVVTEVKISDLLPGDMRLAENNNDTIMVYVTIMPEDSEEYKVDVDQIQTDNIDPDLTVSYDQTELVLRVEGTEDSLKQLSDSTVSCTIDLKDYKAGDYTSVPVKVVLPDGCTLLTDATINIHLKSSTSGADTGSSQESAADSGTAETTSLKAESIGS